MKISFRKNDLEKSLQETERQLSSVERAVRSLENIGPDPKRSNEFYHRLESLQSMAKKFVQLIADTQTILMFHMWRPDRMIRLTDGEKRTTDLLVQLKLSFATLSPLGMNLQDDISKARRAKSIDERAEYIDVLRLSVSGLKETVAGLAHVVEELMKLDRPRFLEGLINGLLGTAVTAAVLVFASNGLVNLPPWFQMLIILIVAIGIFLSCLRGKPPVIAIFDLG